MAWYQLHFQIKLYYKLKRSWQHLLYILICSQEKRKAIVLIFRLLNMQVKIHACAAVSTAVQDIVIIHHVCDTLKEMQLPESFFRCCIIGILHVECIRNKMIFAKIKLCWFSPKNYILYVLLQYQSYCLITLKSKLYCDSYVVYMWSLKLLKEYNLDMIFFSYVYYVVFSPVGRWGTVLLFIYFPFLSVCSVKSCLQSSIA